MFFYSFSKYILFSSLIEKKYFNEYVQNHIRARELISKGKILDIGCSAGLFLSSLGSNYETVGIEPSKAAFREAQKITPNSTLYNKKLSDVHFQNEEFDIITMWDVIEHFDSPNKSLKLINKILKLNGYLILVTPNFSGLLSIAMRKRWIHLIRGHLFYFNKDTIEKILSINNFEVIKIKSYIRYFKISYLLTRVGLIKKEFKVPKFLKFLDFTVPINLSDSLLIVAKKIN